MPTAAILSIQRRRGRDVDDRDADCASRRRLPTPTAAPHGDAARRRRAAAAAAAPQRARHGSRAARHLQQGNLEPSDRDPRLPAQAHRSAGAARTARIGVSRHPYLERQLEDGGGAPRHPHHRAAEPGHAQGVRQRPWPVRRGAGDARARRCAPSTTWSRTSTNRRHFSRISPSLLARLHELEAEIDADDRQRMRATTSARRWCPRCAAARVARAGVRLPPRAASAPAGEAIRRRGGVRSRDRQHLQRRGHRIARGRARSR